MSASASNPQALLQQGVSLLQQGDLESAAERFRAVLSVQPKQPDALNLLAVIEHELGNSKEAFKLVRQAVKAAPKIAPYQRNLGLIALALGHFKDAVAGFRAAVKRDPRDAASHNDLGTAYGQMGRADEEISEYDRAIGIDSGFADAYFNKGNALARLDRDEDALLNLDRAIELNPRHADALSNKGLVLKKLKRFDEALLAARQAVELDGDSLDALNNLGVVLVEKGDIEQGLTIFESVIERQGDFFDAHINLCEWLERTNRVDDFKAAIERATAVAGQASNPELLFYRARLAFREKRFDDARKLLERINYKQLPERRWRAFSATLATVYDKAEMFAKAFQQVEFTNQLVTKLQPDARQMAAVYGQRVDALEQAWSAVEQPPEWSGQDYAEPTGDDDAAPELAFLVGFPRSGTTLLENVLRSHPEVCALEEPPFVDDMRRDLDIPATPENLAGLAAEQLVGLRALYLEKLRGADDYDPSARIVIDKQPLNMTNAALIHRVFPHARFIFALRHPYDVAFSCLMQDFNVNLATANFLSLQTTAQLYNTAMRLWAHYRRVLRIDVVESRYESMVVDLRGTSEPVLAHLGLEWDDRLLEFQQTVKQRKMVRTASYEQVSQSLYTGASGRWVNYQRSMSKVDDQLGPWVQAFGYANADD